MQFSNDVCFKRWDYVMIATLTSLLMLISGLLFEIQAQPAVTLAEGTPVQVRLTQVLGTETNEAGDRFEVILDRDLRSEGSLIAAAGSVLIGEVLEAEQSGRVKGRARMALTLREIRLDGVDYPITTSTIVIEAEGTRGEDAKVIGGSAGVGALLGAIIGGKRGAVIGATVGAGAGTTAVLVTDGKEVRFEPEQQFRFHLEEPFRADSSLVDSSTGLDQSRRIPGRRGSRTELRDSIDELRSYAAALRSRVQTDFIDASVNSTELRLYVLMSNFCDTIDLIYKRFSQGSVERPLSSDIVSHLEAQQGEINRSLEVYQVDNMLTNQWGELEESLAELLSLSSSISQGSGDSLDRNGSLSWRGYVDEEDYVILQDDAVQVQNSKGRPAWNISYRLSNPLPRGPVQMTLDQAAGRGQVEILERPSQWNDYRAVIRIVDPESGSDYYMFDLDWMSEDDR